MPALVYAVLYLLTLSSIEGQTCLVSVARARFGDQIVALRYSGRCDQNTNPCYQVSGLWRDSRGRANCKCNCPTNATYREDLRTCVPNEKNREGCNLLFKGEREATAFLRVFNNSSSLRLSTPPGENCEVTQNGTAFVTVKGWQPVTSSRPPFMIRHEDKKRDKHAHFLEWNASPFPPLFGRIVRVSIQCKPTRRFQTLTKLCIVFKVRGSISPPCPYTPVSPSIPGPTSAVATSLTTQTLKPTVPVNSTTRKPVIDIKTVILPTTPSSESPANDIDNDKRQTADTGNPQLLPSWLIGVVVGAAVVATVIIMVIIWMCCKMRHRSTKRRKRRRHLSNPPHRSPDGNMIAFAPTGDGQGTDEAGYTRIGSPRNGYAQLKELPQRTSSEYQRLLKPGEDQAGYLIPLEEPEKPTCTQEEIYTEPDHNAEPQNKTRSKDYDYAKPDGLVFPDHNSILQAVAKNWDLSREDNVEESQQDGEAGYVGTKKTDVCSEDDSNDDFEPVSPVSPLYRVVEGPDAPPSPLGDVEEEVNPVKEQNDVQAGYIEVLAETDLDSRT